MVATTKVIEVEPGSELDKLLEQAHDAKLILVRNGERFHVTPETTERPDYIIARKTDIFADYDPKRIHEMLEELERKPLLTPEEAEAMIEYIYRAREEGTRPADRP